MKCYNCGWLAKDQNQNEYCGMCLHKYQDACDHKEAESFSGQQRCKECKLKLQTA